MSIYRRLNRATGKRSRYYSAEFEYRGHRHRRSGFVDRDSARHWVSAEMLRLRRGAVGYVKALHHAPVAPLIAEFVARLRADGRDPMYCYITERRLERLARECGWVTLQHVTRESLDQWAAGRSEYRGRAIGALTKNQYIDSAVEWGKWLCHPAVAKLPVNPLAHARKLPAKRNDAYRRAGTLEEIEKLLSTCARDRRCYYQFRIYTPIRRKTIRQMTWRMMHLDAAPPFAKLPAEINKSRRDEKHVVRYQLAQELRREKKRRKAKPDDLVFPDAPTLEDLRADLKAAGVAFDDAKGNRRLDFHAMRRTLVRLAKRAGLSLDEASLLLGHKDPRTTRKYYDDDAVAPELGAMIERLPELGKMRRAQ